MNSKEKDDQKKGQEKKESDSKLPVKPEAILPTEKKKPEVVKDTVI